ncbi:MAG: GH25 family lysozyme [Methanothrix sp.]
MLIPNLAIGKTMNRQSASLAVGLLLVLMICVGMAVGSSHMRSDSDIPHIPIETQNNSTVKAYEGGTEALLIQDQLPWNVDSNDLALTELGVSHDVISSTELATTVLSKYIFIMYASDQPTSYYTNINKNIDKISTYVKNGGFLIAHCCDGGWNNGDWSGLKILPGASTIGHTLTYCDTIQINSPDNPISNGLTDDLLSNWKSANHGYLTKIPSTKVDVVMDTNKGCKGKCSKAYPTYINYQYGDGTVLATTQTVEWQYAGYNKENALKALLNNEITIARRPRGIDVSCNQGTIRWTPDPNNPKLSSVADASGLSFAYVKASSWAGPTAETCEKTPLIPGCSCLYKPTDAICACKNNGNPAKKGTHQNDNRLIANIDGALDSHLKVGVYHYAYPKNDPGINGAIAEAEWFVRVAGRYIGPGYLPPALDLEEAPPRTKNTNTDFADWIIAWMTTVQSKTRVMPIIYTGPSFASSYLTDTRLSRYTLWTSNYKYDPLKKPNSAGIWKSTWSIWQWTDKGKIPGITQNTVDLNVFSGTQSELSNLVVQSPTDVCPHGCKNSSIQATVDAATPGGTIDVAEGTA